MHFNKILITSDFTQQSLPTLELAAYERKMEGSEIILLHVAFDWEVPQSVLNYVPDPQLVAKYREAIHKEARSKLEEAALKHLHGQKVKIEVLLSSESAGDVISRYARENGCDLIVMATNARGTIGNFFIGSTVQRVLQQAPCPVLVVPSVEIKK
ncbi:MAG: universal stress protein [Deltaproteobacteria bacterium]|nr:universal stress protein [Deltaproteobacteria bacterium]